MKLRKYTTNPKNYHKYKVPKDKFRCTKISLTTNKRCKWKKAIGELCTMHWLMEKRDKRIKLTIHNNRKVFKS